MVEKRKSLKLCFSGPFARACLKNAAAKFLYDHVEIIKEDVDWTKRDEHRKLRMDKKVELLHRSSLSKETRMQ